jgi:hypothetical protein
MAPHLLADAAGAARLDLVLVPQHGQARGAAAVVQAGPPARALAQHRHQRALAGAHAARHCARGAGLAQAACVSAAAGVLPRAPAPLATALTRRASPRQVQCCQRWLAAAARVRYTASPAARRGVWSSTHVDARARDSARSSAAPHAALAARRSRVFCDLYSQTACGWDVAFNETRW